MASLVAIWKIYFSLLLNQKASWLGQLIKSLILRVLRSTWPHWVDWAVKPQHKHNLKSCFPLIAEKTSVRLNVRFSSECPETGRWGGHRLNLAKVWNLARSDYLLGYVPLIAKKSLFDFVCRQHKSFIFYQIFLKLADKADMREMRWVKKKLSRLDH